jgi:ankyrin repeat protein
MPQLFEEACRTNSSDKVHEFLSGQPPLDVEITNKKGETGLMIAAAHGAVDSLKVLIEKKANQNATDLNGLTALIYALNNNQCKAAKTLVEKKADLELTFEGQTILHLAAKKG